MKRVDRQYSDDLKDALRGGSHPLPHVMLALMLVVTLVGLAWAQQAVIEEVTTGFGKVIPSGRVQQVQSLEGGILSELLVAEGQIVKRNQLLLRIDDTNAAAAYRDVAKRKAALQASIARLSAEAEGKDLSIPVDLAKKFPDLAFTERALYESRRQTLEHNLSSLSENLATSRIELAALEATVIRLAAEARGEEPRFPKQLRKSQPTLVMAEMALYQARQRTLRENLRSMKRSLALASQELKMKSPLVEKGVVSEIEVLHLRRQVNELQGKINEEFNSFRQAAAQYLNEKKNRMLERQRQYTELKSKLQSSLNVFRTQARAELNEKKNELTRLEESLVASEARVARNELRSPVHGVVKALYLNTIGGVIRPGMSVMEIVPLDDSLLVEAKIRPTDIAFISPAQKATVKVTAYDFSIYGSLEGEVVNISADTITENTGEPYYLIKVRTARNYLEKAGKRLPIKPGMTTTVDVLTGRKSVLAYLVKPFVKARYQAMRER